MIPVPASSSAPPPRLPLHSGGPPLPPPSPLHLSAGEKGRYGEKQEKEGEERGLLLPRFLFMKVPPPLPPLLSLSLSSCCCHLLALNAIPPFLSPPIGNLSPPSDRPGERKGKVGPPLFRYDADFAIAIVRNAGRRRITHSKKTLPKFF